MRPTSEPIPPCFEARRQVISSAAQDAPCTISTACRGRRCPLFPSPLPGIRPVSAPSSAVLRPRNLCLDGTGSEQTSIVKEWTRGFGMSNPFESSGCNLPRTITGLSRMSLSKRGTSANPQRNSASFGAPLV